jgi:hypothetical protein
MGLTASAAGMSWKLQRSSGCGGPKFKAGVTSFVSGNVDDFVTAEALSFNQTHSTSTKKLQTIQNPVIVFEGQVLDGRNRLLACQAAHVEPLRLAP